MFKKRKKRSAVRIELEMGNFRSNLFFLRGFAFFLFRSETTLDVNKENYEKYMNVLKRECG